MSDIKIQPSATGSATVTLTAPATGTARTVTLPNSTGSLIADDGSGNIGIGETTPLAKVHIKRGDSGLTSLNAAGDHIFLENTGANGTGITLASGNTANGSIIFGDQDSNYRGVLIYDHSADAMKIVTAGSERMRITSDGKVGINTNSPAYALHIDATSQGGRLMLENTANGNTGIFMRVKNGSSQVGNSTIRQENNGDISIYQGTSSEALRATLKQGGGICFNSDTAAANALDDYEEGTWTPTAGGGLSGLTKTDCFYTKIGNMVHLQGRVSGFTGINSSTLYFGGLPFNPQYSTSNALVATTFVDLDQGYQLWCHLSHGEPKIYFRYMMNNAQYSSLAGSDVSSSSNMYFNATYTVA